jgi:hypothetical protein
VRPLESEIANKEPNAAGFIPFANVRKEFEAMARQREEERRVEERRQANLRQKLLLLQVCLASPWAVKRKVKPVGWRPQLSGQGIEE